MQADPTPLQPAQPWMHKVAALINHDDSWNPEVIVDFIRTYAPNPVVGAAHLYESQLANDKAVVMIMKLEHELRACRGSYNKLANALTNK